MNTIRGRLGEYGSNIVADTTAMTGNWHAITGYSSAAIFSVLTDAGASTTGTVGTLLLSPGDTVYGSFTAFTLASGSVKAYKSRLS